ncbi:MAG: glycosyltransferase family 2 protein [Gammaproteobacteria bacterium]|nr:glycosyltransferase family 2 protein [Gammaproteobacteria bacterium]
MYGGGSANESVDLRASDGVPVSVVIPAYNAGNTIAETLCSVLAQTHRPLDIVVVDDGSRDDTREVLRSFGDAIRVIHQANSGIGVARNRGLAEARAPFIALLDADDLCLPERIAVQLKYLLAHPDILLCSSDFGAFDEHGLLADSYIASYYTSCSPQRGGVHARYPLHGTFDIADVLQPSGREPVIVAEDHGRVYEQLAFGNFIHPPTVMFRRETLAVAGTFDPTEKIVCEWEWFVRVARCGNIGYIDRPLLRYRRSATQISSDPQTPADSLSVAHKIHARDPDFRRRFPEAVRRQFGVLNLDAADAVVEIDRRKSLRLLSASVFAYRVLRGQTLRTLVKILLPAWLLQILRALRRRRSAPRNANLSNGR